MKDSSSYVFRRIIATMIDVCILGVIAAMIFFVITPIGETSIKQISNDTWISISTSLLLFILKDSIYGISFGRWALNIKVKCKCRPNIVSCALRNLLLIIWPIELFLLLKNGKRIGDLITNSDVVLRKHKQKGGIVFLKIIGAVLIMLALIMAFTYTQIRNDPSYKASIVYINKSREINEVTGGIQGYSKFFTASVQNYDNDSTAVFHFKVYGKKKNLNVTVQLHKDSMNIWMVDDLAY